MNWLGVIGEVVGLVRDIARAYPGETRVEIRRLRIEMAERIRKQREYAEEKRRTLGSYGGGPRNN